MGHFEINAELADVNDGIENYQIFVDTINSVRDYYISYLGEEFMNKIDLYVDNATRDSGYTPVTITVLNKYVIIKLRIDSSCDAAEIAYQFVHELMHFVCRVKYGLGKEWYVNIEEAICSAASLVYIHEVYPDSFEYYDAHVQNLTYPPYRQGSSIAKDINYNFAELLNLA